MIEANKKIIQDLKNLELIQEDLYEEFKNTQEYINNLNNLESHTNKGFNKDF